jgi:hypothetical protein
METESLERCASDRHCRINECLKHYPALLRRLAPTKFSKLVRRHEKPAESLSPPYGTVNGPKAAATSDWPRLRGLL